MKYGVFGNYGHSNIGDEAILRGLLSLLSGKEVNVFTDSLEASKSIHPEDCKFFLLKPALRGRVYMLPIILVLLIKNILKNDVVIIGGGGLFNEINKTAFFQYIFLLLVSRMMLKRVYIVGVSVGPLNSRLLKGVLKMSSILANKIYVRDIDSLNYFWCSKAVVIPDLSLGANTKKKSKKEFDVLEVSHIVSISLMDVTKTNSKKTQLNYIKQIKLFLMHLKKIEVNLKVQLIAMDFEKDFKVLEVLKLACQEHGIEYEVLNIDNFQKLEKAFARSNFVVATRLHSAILAILYEKPFLAISYQDKVKNYFSSHRLDDSVVDIIKINVVDLVSIYKKNISEKSSVQYSLKKNAKLQLNEVIKGLM